MAPSDRYANNRVEGDHGRRGHYELAVDAPVNQRVAVVFDELAAAICSKPEVAPSAHPWSAQPNSAFRVAGTLR